MKPEPLKDKKAYFVEEEDADYGVGVVAHSTKEAKKLAWSDDTFMDAEWVDVRVKWKKGVGVSNLKVGIIEDCLLALKLGIYGFIEYETCPSCKTEETMVYYDRGKYYCSNCEDG